ncbi:sensor histidine kinase YesM [Flavobacterium gossypii]|uniref:Sensor histidine kinase YesM n=1 Tax=Flavobacterium gossypii TaxID=1646119 RepID=A0ABR6DRI0_9FLAO|nr:histidine kinase [Flavobacterium gossypii]MBA9074291.1 sensor histidine kinase YesM [Flavobacterium gossypii]
MAKELSSQPSPMVNFLIEKRYRIYRHLVIWLYLILTEFSQPMGPIELTGNYAFYLRVANTLSFALLVYLNMYVLVPRLLFKEKYLQYLLVLIFMIILFYVGIEGTLQYKFEGYRSFKEQENSSLFMAIIDHTNLWIIVMLASTSIKLFQRGRRDAVRMSDLKKSSLEAELGELKNQLNPHFLFNMLNNVNTLVFTEPKIASVIIMKLSGFLRYLLYDNNKNTVSLQSEIKFLTNFLELENIRRDDFSFWIENHSPEETALLSIPPNLFLIFVENAAKHSKTANAPSNVSLSFKSSKDKLVFTCQNTKSKVISPRPEAGGLGLANIRRRLDLLYEGRHDLELYETEELYKVTLTIPL